ncbi:hypothetical protein KCU61_g804, partial [Aureobasidium melanogenum]
MKLFELAAFRTLIACGRRCRRSGGEIGRVEGRLFFQRKFIMLCRHSRAAASFKRTVAYRSEWQATPLSNQQSGVKKRSHVCPCTQSVTPFVPLDSVHFACRCIGDRDARNEQLTYLKVSELTKTIDDDIEEKPKITGNLYRRSTSAPIV